MPHFPQHHQEEQLIETIIGIDNNRSNQIRLLGRYPCGFQCQHHPPPLPPLPRLILSPYPFPTQPQCCMSSLLSPLSHLLLLPLPLPIHQSRTFLLPRYCLHPPLFQGVICPLPLPDPLPHGFSGPVYAGLQAQAQLNIPTFLHNHLSFLIYYDLFQSTWGILGVV